MPKTSIPLNDLSISISVVMGLISVLVSGYIALIIKNINLQIENIKEKVKEIKEHIEKHEDNDKKTLNECFERLRDVETIQTVIKTEHDKNHGGRK